MGLVALLVVLSYLLGAVPFGLLLARSAGVDVRRAGSGNIGATNVARTAGKTLGLLTLLLDALKGALPTALALHLFPGPRFAVLLGLAAVLGHVFPVFLRFRGGKGVATAAGVFVALTPLAAGAAVAVFALSVLLTRTVSVGSLLAAPALVVAVLLLDGRPEVLALASSVAALVVVRHAGNVRRLLAREEPRLGVREPSDADSAKE